MAMSARASNIGGTLIAEKRNGSRRFHAHDSLGSTIALVSDSSKETDTYTYWPYGEIRTSTGSTTSTPFKFCGAWGYYDDGNQLYVRARYLRTQLGRWITRDPLWPTQASYGYVMESPINSTDASGLQPVPGGSCSPLNEGETIVTRKFSMNHCQEQPGVTYSFTLQGGIVIIGIGAGVSVTSRVLFCHGWWRKTEWKCECGPYGCLLGVPIIACNWRKVKDITCSGVYIKETLWAGGQLWYLREEYQASPETPDCPKSEVINSLTRDILIKICKALKFPADACDKLVWR
jgi:RHS repeat-associated protein